MSFYDAMFILAAGQLVAWILLVFVLFRLGMSVGELKAQLGQMHQNLYFIERRIMSALSDFQAAQTATTASIDALAARVAALPAAAATEADLAAASAVEAANKAKLDGIAAPAPAPAA